MTSYRPVPPQVDLPAMEREILDFWREKDIFTRSIERNETAAAWTFYEGPPTANGRPGAHHVESRTFKDIFPRFKTMQGFNVSRKGGWDCHGLPVELAVEKELGFSGKADIENFGIAEFNAQCRESVQRHVDLWEDMTERMGCWLDMREPYRTMDPEYVQSVWWALKQIHSAGKLTEDYRVAPYCPRCGTGLSDHELAQGYETVTDPSVYVRLPLTSGPHAGEADLLIWTTTPWTLPSNALVAAHAELTYVLAHPPADTAGRPVVVAEVLKDKVLGEEWVTTATMTGADMVGWSYQRPFDIVDWPGRAHFVVTEEYVSAEDGTGLVHQAPAFGEDDFASCRRNGVELVNPITPQGAFEAEIPLVGGTFFREANQVLLDDLKQRSVLFRNEPYEHTYPHCWRCHTALLYYAQPSWYIKTTAIKDELLAENEATNWFPETVKHGRYGDWLNNNIDWALSRSRYWGTPLPIWRCEAGHQTCVESLAELSQLTGTDQSKLDPHRPFVDEVAFACPQCQAESRRVPEVIDAWFDSGSMPFAQWGYPFAEGSGAMLEQAYPADFICEAIDQTRGWFYTLMTVGTLVMERSSYKNVLCLGHILAEDGRKMSKHLGNTLEPIPLMDQHGADAVRWFMAAGGSPWAARRVGHGTITETVRKVLLTYWNTVAFQVLYAGLSDWHPDSEAPAPAERPALDRWALSEAQRVISDVTTALEAFDTQRAGSRISAFVDDLSNWYVRRSRRRFWDGDPAALATLHECIAVATQLMAPIAPFISERVWQDMFAATTSVESVHLSDWPTPDPELVDDLLSKQITSVRRVVELGRAARAEAKVRTRQPLGRALISSAAYELLTEDLHQEICAELNVAKIEPLSIAGADLVDHSAKGNFRSLGKRFAKRTPIVAQAIAETDAAALARSLAATGSATITVEGEEVEVGAEDVIISERPREGWSVLNEQGETVALDLEITPELMRAGVAREVVRAIQEARKTSGFEVSDRIELRWSANETTTQAVNEHLDQIAEEVLAISATNEVGHHDHAVADIGFDFSLTKVEH